MAILQSILFTLFSNCVKKFWWQKARLTSHLHSPLQSTAKGRTMLFFEKYQKIATKKIAKKIKKLRFWHLAFSSGYSTKMMHNVMKKSPYLCLLCIFFGYEKMSFGPKAVQKNTKNVKKNELSMHTGINIPSRIPKIILKIQKKTSKKHTN